MPVSPAERDYLLAQVDRLAQTDLNNLWRQAESLATVDFFTYVRAAFPEIVNVYHQTAGQLAATWFEQSNPESPYVAQVVEPIVREQLLSSAEWALGGDGTVALDRMSGTLQRGVYNGARDTVVLNAEATRSRWIRVARPTACEFCRLLATKTGEDAYTSRRAAEVVVGRRGRPRSEKKTARKLGQKYHDFCHCQAVEVRSTQTVDEVLNDEQRKLFQQWTDEYEKAVANAGTTDTKKLLAAWRQQNSSIIPVSASAATAEDVLATLERKTENDLIVVQNLIRRTGRPESEVIRDANATNPSWVPPEKHTTKTDKRYTDNCTHCVTAYELRRRGYDVEATRSPKVNGRNMREILPRWVDQDGNPRGMTMSGYNSLEVDRAVESWGPGSRGWVVVEWEDGGSHVFAVENVGGKPVYVEPQHPMLGSGTAESHFQKVKQSLGSVYYVRVDDLVPTAKIIDPQDPLVRSASQGKSDREKISQKLAKAEAARARKIEREKAVTPSGAEIVAAYKAQAPTQAPSFTQGVFNTISLTPKQQAAARAKLSLEEQVAYQTGVNWYKTWLAANRT